MNFVDNNGLRKEFIRNLVSRHFHKHGSTSQFLGAASTAGANVLTLSSSGSFSTGMQIEINSSEGIFNSDYRSIVATNGRTITVDSPVDCRYSTAASILRVACGMNIANEGGSAIGTSNPATFFLDTPINETWVVDEIIVSICDDRKPDDSRFGGLNALSNGCVLRLRTSTGLRTLANWKTNGDMVRDMYDVDFRDGAGEEEEDNGIYGIRGRWLFTKIKDHIVLDGSSHERIELLIQDNLSGLADFRIKGQGRVLKRSTN